VRKAVDAWGLRLCAKEQKWQSDTVSAVLVPDGIDSAAVVRRAHQAYNTSLGVGLSKVAGKVFRIGHLGWLNDVMVCGALSAAEMALLDCGVKLAAGSGVGAAIEHFRLSERPVIAKAA
jgi:alanine-glyoxylate transaminase/serine-glyoxylate transaminase/serine-pyruvate transaminase